MATKTRSKTRLAPRKGARRKKRSSKSSRSAKSRSKPLIKLGSSSGVELPVEDIKGQLTTYANQIQDYLNQVNAKVDLFNFGVEKNDNNITIDCEVKAVIGGQ
jgi:hypothetical protein